MGNWRFHTPDGVQDTLPDDCARKRAMEAMLRTVFAARGYLEVETPGLEFYDVYAAGRGLAPQEGLFKLFDAQGRILALRYDGTVPVARLAATLLKDEAPPLRLAYIGNMVRFAGSGGGKQSEFTQAGIELMGPQTAEAAGIDQNLKTCPLHPHQAGIGENTGNGATALGRGLPVQSLGPHPPCRLFV